MTVTGITKDNPLGTSISFYGNNSEWNFAPGSCSNDEQGLDGGEFSTNVTQGSYKGYIMGTCTLFAALKSSTINDLLNLTQNFYGDTYPDGNPYTNYVCKQTPVFYFDMDWVKDATKYKCNGSVCTYNYGTLART